MHWKKQWWQQAGTYFDVSQPVIPNQLAGASERTAIFAPLPEKTKDEEMNKPDKNEKYLMTQEAADYLRLSARTLERMRVEGTGPKFRKAGPGKRARVLYLRSDLENWLERYAYVSTSEYDAT